MSSDRLIALAQNIRDLKEQLSGVNAALVEARLEDEAALNQRKRRLQGKIAGFEQEYQEVLQEESETAIAEIVEVVPTVANSPEISPEVLEWLQKIYAAVREPQSNAAAKLEAFISPLPPFIGIAVKGELDTESTVRKYFPTFTKLIDNVRRLPKK